MGTSKWIWTVKIKRILSFRVFHTERELTYMTIAAYKIWEWEMELKCFEALEMPGKRWKYHLMSVFYMSRIYALFYHIITKNKYWK